MFAGIKGHNTCRLPTDIEQVVLSNLSEKHLANVRLVSKAGRTSADNEVLYDKVSLNAKKAFIDSMPIVNEINAMSLLVENSRESLLRAQQDLDNVSLMGRIALWMDDYREILGQISLIFVDFLFSNFESLSEVVQYQKRLKEDIWKDEVFISSAENEIAEFSGQLDAPKAIMAEYRNRSAAIALTKERGKKFSKTMSELLGAPFKELPYFDNSQHKEFGRPFDISPLELSHPIMRTRAHDGKPALLLRLTGERGQVTICTHLDIFFGDKCWGSQERDPP